MSGTPTRGSSVHDGEGVDPDGGGVEDGQRSQAVGDGVILEGQKQFLSIFMDERKTIIEHVLSSMHMLSCPLHTKSASIEMWKQ